MTTFTKLFAISLISVSALSAAPASAEDVQAGPIWNQEDAETKCPVAAAAVRDTDFAERCVRENARWRDWLRNALVQMGVGCDESYANFVLARFSNPDEAAACNAALKADGIIVRPVGSYKLPNCLRITVGDEAACRRVIHVIATFKGIR